METKKQSLPCGQSEHAHIVKQGTPVLYYQYC